MVNQITSFIFALDPVSVGVQRLMGIAVGGQIIAGWAFGGVIVMGAVGFALLAIIFLKVAIVLVGALLALPLLWACTFAVGALLINDTNRAGALVGGSGTIAHLFGGLLVGLAGLASLWLCLKIARELGGMLRTQLGGLLALAHARGASPAATAAARGDGTQSLRSFTQRGWAGGRRGGRRAVWHATGRCRRGTPRGRSCELRARRSSAALARARWLYRWDGPHAEAGNTPPPPATSHHPALTGAPLSMAPIPSRQGRTPLTVRASAPTAHSRPRARTRRRAPPEPFRARLTVGGLLSDHLPPPIHDRRTLRRRCAPRRRQTLPRRRARRRQGPPRLESARQRRRLLCRRCAPRRARRTLRGRADRPGRPSPRSGDADLPSIE